MKKFKNKKMLLILLLVLALGLISGFIFAFFIEKTDMLILKENIENYINIINQNFSYKEAIFKSISNNLVYLLVILVCTIVFILFPVVVFLLFYKAFSVGFLVSILIFMYKLKGIYYFFIFIFPSVIINLFLCLLISQISIKVARQTIKSLYKNENINIRNFYKKYLTTFLIFVGLFVINSLIEVFVGTFLIRTFI